MLFRKILKEGSGTPLVFLHGFLGTSSDWEPVCSYLPPSPCFAFDLPGHGHSPFAKEIYLDLPRFHLIGYSMGGRIAMTYAAKHPEQVASLTILSAHPGLKSEEEKRKRRESDKEWARLLLSLPIDQFLQRWYSQPLFQSFRPDLSIRRKQNTRDLALSLVHYSLGNQPFYDLEQAIVGENDFKFRSLYKKPILISNAGHVVHLERPQQVAQTLQLLLNI